jgi:ketosteroid isomerase-like protein
MNRRAVWIAAGAAIVAAVLVWFFFFRASDEALVRDCVARAAAAVRTTEDDTNPLTRMARLKREMRECLDKDVRVSLQEVQGVPASITGREALANATAQALGMFEKASVDLSSVEVKLDDAHRSAQVTATASFDATERGGRPRRERRDLSMLVVKGDDGWRITTVTVWAPRD